MDSLAYICRFIVRICEKFSNLVLAHTFSSIVNHSKFMQHRQVQRQDFIRWQRKNILVVLPEKFVYSQANVAFVIIKYCQSGFFFGNLHRRNEMSQNVNKYRLINPNRIWKRGYYSLKLYFTHSLSNTALYTCYFCYLCQTFLEPKSWILFNTANASFIYIENTITRKIVLCLEAFQLGNEQCSIKGWYSVRRRSFWRPKAYGRMSRYQEIVSAFAILNAILHSNFDVSP